jgi:endonuclease YncB( thermonuclease family)
MRFFYEAKVGRVVDGDTVDFIIDLGFDVAYKARVRLHGVNTPESRTRDLEEKELGIAAKNYVYDWLAGHDTVFIKTMKDGTGKYGRILGYIYSDEEMMACLNDDIIDSGHGEPYYGGKR